MFLSRNKKKCNIYPCNPHFSLYNVGVTWVFITWTCHFPFLDRDVPRSPSYGVYISQLIRIARVCSNVDDFNNKNLFLTAKLLKQGLRYHKIRKAFSKFYHRHSDLTVKYNIGLKVHLQQGISEPIFYGDLVY